MQTKTEYEAVSVVGDEQHHFLPTGTGNTSTLCGLRAASTVFGTVDCAECIKMRRSLAVIDGSGA